MFNRRMRGFCGAVALAIAVAGLIARPVVASPEAAHGMDVLKVNPNSDNSDRGNAKPSRPGAKSPNLTYRGSAVATAPAIYVVFWGSQWSSDPSGEAAYLKNFYSGLSNAGGDTWSTSATQYCQGALSGATSCATVAADNHVGHPATSPLAASPWYDNAAAPSSPTQSQLAAEAVKAVGHFGAPTAGYASAQYVIATAHNNNSSGFGTQYCAWHSSTTSGGNRIAYTNLPYMTDAGGSCGQGFVNGANGLLDGVSIVAGHEYAETITDPYPNGGWLDSGGAENADKCAWIRTGTPGGASSIVLTTGSFAVQSLWSNSFNSSAGGCVISYSNDAQSQ